MPYTFIDIEKQKTRIIKGIFLVLLVFYFFIAVIIWLVTKIFIQIAMLLHFFAEGEALTHTVSLRLFSLGEVAIVLFAACVIAVIHWYFSSRDMINKMLDILEAAEPDPKDSYHQVFKNIVEEVRVATGSSNIYSYIVPSSSLNAFAMADFKGNAVIGVTEGLLARLNRSQLEAVVGHEAAHVVSGDSLLATVTCSLFGIYAALLDGIGKVVGRDLETKGGQSAPAIIAIFYLAIISVLLMIAAGINFLMNVFLSRQREYRADATAVRLIRNPIPLAEALYAISRGWRGSESIPDSFAPIFITNPEYNKLEESEGVIPDLLSTHPPIKKRIGALLNMAGADMSALKESIKNKIPPEKGTVEFKEQPKREWLIYKDNSWQGPFDIKKLLELGLAPLFWVSRLDEVAFGRASDYADLNTALKDGLAGKDIKESNFCPECKQPLYEVLYEGAPVLKCHYCDGILANRDVILRIMAREEYEFSQSVAKRADLASKMSSEAIKKDIFKVTYELDCPTCKNKMRRKFFSYVYPIEIDECQMCQCVWFDKDELEILQCMFEKSR